MSPHSEFAPISPPFAEWQDAVAVRSPSQGAHAAQANMACEPRIDAVQQKLWDSIARLSALDDSSFTAAYGRFIAEVEEGFRLEERWMEDADYPAHLMHREQHARVLGALHCSHAQLAAGNTAVGRTIVEDLFPKWFELHSATLDMALAIYLQVVSESNATGAASVR